MSRRIRPSSRRRSPRATGTTSSFARSSVATRTPKEIFVDLAIEDVRRGCDLLRRVWEDTGRRRRLRLARGRSGSRLRPRRLVRGGDALPRARRPAEPVREDPGNRARPRRDRGLHRRRPLDQHHAHLLARAPCAGHRGVHPRARAARRRRRRSRPRRVGRELLRLPRRHRGRPADSRSSAGQISRGSSRSRTRSSRTSST